MRVASMISLHEQYTAVRGGTQVSFDLDVTDSGLHNLDLIVNGKSGSDYTVGITIILIYPRAE